MLGALVEGIAAGDDNAARAALARIDWVLRRPARRRLERALIDAALAVPEATDAPDDVRHVLRVAALRVAGRHCDPADRDEVAALYRRLRVPPPAGWPATIVAGVVALALLAGTAVLVRGHLPRTRHRDYARVLPPPSVGAYRDGGQPLADPALAALLARELPALLTACDQRAPDLEPQRLALRAPAAITAHGAALASAWATLIDALGVWANAAEDNPVRAELADQLASLARGVSDAFAAAGLGYFVEGEVVALGDRRHAVVYAYRVEDVRFVSAGARSRRVLSVRRLDDLAIRHALLGLESPELGDPVVLLDRIEAHVATTTLPVLARGTPYRLGDASWMALDEARAVARAAGDAVRAELARGLGADAEAAADVAGLLVERAGILERWRSDLATRNLTLADFESLFLPDGILDQLSEVVSPTSRRKVEAIEDELAALDAPRIAARVQDLIVHTTRHHEAQHGFDEEALMHAGQLDIGAIPGVGVTRLPESERGEISAYISQIANDATTPQLAYWHLANFAFDRHQWGRTEADAAVLITAGLAKHLHVALDGDLIKRGQVDRRALAVVGKAIAGVSGEALRAAARATWQDLFDAPLAMMVDGRQ